GGHESRLLGPGELPQVSRGLPRVFRLQGRAPGHSDGEGYRRLPSGPLSVREPGDPEDRRLPRIPPSGDRVTADDSRVSRGHWSRLPALLPRGAQVESRRHRLLSPAPLQGVGRTGQLLHEPRRGRLDHGEAALTLIRRLYGHRPLAAPPQARADTRAWPA